MIKRLGSPSLWVFVLVGLVYLANGRTIGAGDTLPARYLPFSLLREHNVDLDEFPFLYGQEALQIYPTLDGVPYFLRYRDGHYLSAYSPGPAIVALPVYAIPVFLGVSPASPWASRLEKLSATVISALSAVFLFWALSELVRRRWALAITAIYAFGTSTWSVSSQALWQHGPSQLFLALFLYFLTRGITNERFLAYAGLAMTGTVVMRPTNLLMALPVAAWGLYACRRWTVRLLFSVLPAAVAFLIQRLGFFGSAGGGWGSATTPTWALFAQVPFLEGLSGLLVSPGRGLFVYSPVLLFSLLGFVALWRRGPSLFKLLPVGAVLIVLVFCKWLLWWGGHSWGPRLLAETMPIFCFCLYPLSDGLDRRRLLKGLFVFLAVLSIATQAIGVLSYDGRWEAITDVERHSAALWSWRHGPLVFYGREAVSLASRLVPLSHRPRHTSANSPELLAASVKAGTIPTETLSGQSFLVPVSATNTGQAVWLATASDDRGAVRLRWRWASDGVQVPEGRASLPYDVPPGRQVQFVVPIRSPSAPGNYTLAIDLVSEPVTWFAGERQPALSAKIAVSARDVMRLLSEVVPPDESSPSVAVSTDRISYRRADRLRLTLELRNPGRPGKFDTYLVLDGPGGGVWFYDGHQPPQPGSWVAWSRGLPLPARATGKFALPLSMFADGAYRWHAMLTDAGTFRVMATAVTGFAIGAGAAR